MPGRSSTSKANGGIRAQFTTEINVAMSLASMAILDALADEIGDPPLYRKAAISSSRGIRRAFPG